jgi:hypothetical protein
MQELLFGPLLLTWGPPSLAFIKQHPWQVFAAVLVFVLLMDLMLRKRSSSRSGDGGDGDLGLFDLGGGDGGDGGGD